MKKIKKWWNSSNTNVLLTWGPAITCCCITIALIAIIEMGEKSRVEKREKQVQECMEEGHTRTSCRFMVQDMGY